MHEVFVGLIVHFLRGEDPGLSWFGGEPIRDRGTGAHGGLNPIKPTKARSSELVFVELPELGSDFIEDDV